MASKSSDHGNRESSDRRTDEPMGQAWSSGAEHLGDSPRARQSGRFYGAAMGRASQRSGEYGSERRSMYDPREQPGYFPGSNPAHDDQQRGPGMRMGSSRYDTAGDFSVGYGNDSGFSRMAGPERGSSEWSPDDRGWMPTPRPLQDRGLGTQMGQSRLDAPRTWDDRTHLSGQYHGLPVGRLSPEHFGRTWHREALTARDVMSRSVKALGRQSTLREVSQLMESEDVGVVPVCDERGRLLGLVTDRDLVVRAFKDDKLPSQIRVADVMTDDVEAVTPDETVLDVIELMGKKQIRRVPVVDRDDRLLGIISLGDIANRADYDHDLQDALHRISNKRSFWSRLMR
jgi:CBS domain-containing protein